MCFPLEPATADAVRKWFDNLHAHSRNLTPETAAAPRLLPAEGDAEGERLWRQYLEVLDGRDKDPAAEPVINADTGEVEQAAEATPSKLNVFPQPDPVFLAVQTAMTKGALVSLDQVDQSRRSMCPSGRKCWARSVCAASAARRGEWPIA